MVGTNEFIFIQSKNIIRKDLKMTAEQVDQWKRERDIAYQTNDENVINAVE